MQESEAAKYKTIIADPPWMESGGGRIKRGADAHYPLMKTKDIISLLQHELEGKIDEEGCHLYLWVTNNFLEDGLEVIQALGFRYVTKITWVKGEQDDDGNVDLDNPGLGQYFRGITEDCLFAVKGMCPYRTRPDGKRAQGLTVIISPRREHSEKPVELYEMAERVSHTPRIEFFARNRREGWDAFGNQLPATGQTKQEGI